MLAVFAVPSVFVAVLAGPALCVVAFLAAAPVVPALTPAIPGLYVCLCMYVFMYVYVCVCVHEHHPSIVDVARTLVEECLDFFFDRFLCLRASLSLSRSPSSAHDAGHDIISNSVSFVHQGQQQNTHLRMCTHLHSTRKRRMTKALLICGSPSARLRLLLGPCRCLCDLHHPARACRLQRRCCATDHWRETCQTQPAGLRHSACQADHRIRLQAAP